MKKVIILSLLLSSVSVGVFAQAPETNPVITTEPIPKVPRMAIGVSAGAMGYGADFAYRLNRFFNVRVGYNTFSFSRVMDESALSTFGLSGLPAGKIAIDVDAKIPTGLATLEFKPFGSAFRLQAGVSYAMSGFGGAAKVRYLESITVNDFSLSPADIGYMKVSYSAKSAVAPYLAVGIGRAVPKKRVGLSLDLGAIYRNSPVIKVEATNLLAGNTANEAPLNRNLAAYKWLPVADLRLAFRF